MKTRRISHPAFNLVLGLLLALGGSLSVFSTAHAQGIVYGDSIPAGVTIQNDVILYGNDVVVDGTVEGDVIALGNSVRVTGTITGTLVSASQSVSITGQVGGSLYAASLLLATLVVLAVSMLFWALSLGALGALTFTVGLFSILLAGAVYVFLVLFCSKLVAAFLIGRLLLTPLSPRAADTKVGCVLLGVLVYLLLAAIPFLGWLVAVAATFFGLGAIWMTVRDTRQL